MPTPKNLLTICTCLTVVAAIPLSTAGCGRAGSGGAEVVGTTTQVSDLIGAVAGDRLHVVSIVSPNADVHEFEPRARDVDAISEARVVFTSGAGLDSWAERLIDNSGSDARVVDIFKGLPVRLRTGTDTSDRREGASEESNGEGESDRSGEFHPHWWGDPRNAVAAVSRIEEVLSEEFPSRADEFRKNARRFAGRANGLDRKIARCFELVPKPKRKLVTNHDAFGYFADRFGLDIAGALIPSLSTEAQPSAGETRKLVNKVKSEEIPVIFTEASVNPKLANAVARDAGVKAEGPLYMDSLGPRGSGAATWLEATRRNSKVVLLGLGGRSAARCLK